MNDRVASHFSSPNVESSNTVTRTSLVASIAAIAKKDWQQLSVHDIRNALVAEPQALASHFTIGTSISSAIANVRHSIVFLPRHTKFTGEFEQSICGMRKSNWFDASFLPSRLSFWFLQNVHPHGLPVKRTPECRKERRC